MLDTDPATIDVGDFTVSSNMSTADELRSQMAEPGEVETPPVADPPDPPVAPVADVPVPPAAPKPATEAERRIETIQQRINRQTWELRETERQIAAAQAERDRVAAEVDQIRRSVPAPAAVGTPALVEPTQESFETYDEYIRAHGTWTRAMAKQEIQELLEQRDTTLRQQTADVRARIDADVQARADAEVLAHHTTRLEDAKRKHADFDAVMTQGIAALHHINNDWLAQHIPHSPLSGDLMYFFASHPEEFERMAALSQPVMLKELGKLEAKLEAAPTGSAASRPSLTRATPPIKPVGTSPSADDAPPADTASLDDHVAYWNRKERDAR